MIHTHKKNVTKYSFLFCFGVVQGFFLIPGSSNVIVVGFSIRPRFFSSFMARLFLLLLVVTVSQTSSD